MNDLRLKQVAIILGVVKAAIGFVLLTKASNAKNSYLSEKGF